jgi:UDP-N-acetylmuramoyl-tripeptide--D-alanyl-D-alanine ligase
MQLLLSKVAEILGCEKSDAEIMLTGAVIDSRQVQAGNLFVALKGEHVDGHDYLETARQAGAGAALVSSKQDSDLPQLVVDDVVTAFGEIAKYWRQQLTVQLIAVTGSNGKTTLKEMLASILRQAGSVIATQGNLNNELGVPLTLTRLDKDTDFAVIEMGANHSGEIARLVEMAKPQISVINNVAAAHLEGFNSIEGVAKAKAEIFSELSETGIGVLNADMPFLNDWKQVLTNKKIVTFALDAEADITANDIQQDSQSSPFMVKLGNEYHYINLPLPGLHNVANSLAAIAITHALNISAEAIVKGLAEMKGVPHRLQIRTGINRSKIIDDSYNANPGSYQQALAVLQSFSGEHWLVLGDFGELGDDNDAIHTQMGIDAKKSGVEKLWTVGKSSKLATDSFGAGSQHFNSVAEMQQQLKNALADNITCLIKGSRFMQLDKLADWLAVEGDA